MEPSDKIKFDFVKMEWKGITVSQVKLWERLYPDVNVVDEILVKMVAWCERQVITHQPLTVKAKGKKRSWKRFIENWLKLEQTTARGL